jgi:hypothetical protein
MANLCISDLDSTAKLKSEHCLETLSQHDQSNVSGGWELRFSNVGDATGMGIGFVAGGSAYGFGIGVGPASSGGIGFAWRKVSLKSS